MEPQADRWTPTTQRVSVACVTTLCHYLNVNETAKCILV